MIDANLYDVFLSYNTQDKSLVEQLARCLKAHGLNVWLDDWNVSLGDSWQKETEKALDCSKACAVLIGSNGIGSWHGDEMRAALQKRHRQPDFKVIPVLLPGASSPQDGALPLFLSDLSWVDLTTADDVCEHLSFNRLVASIRGKFLSQDHKFGETPIGECPYRGLREFDEEHAKYFFGRENLTQALLDRLRSTRFLSIIGTSGSGKSSLVRAGLLPHLKQGALTLSEQWTYVTIRPGEHPLKELALSLARARAIDPKLDDYRQLLTNLESDEGALHGYVRLSISECRQDCRFVIFIDQFEEIFSCPDLNEQTQFVNNLLYAVTVKGGQTVILLTMRDDFMSRAAALGRFAELLLANKFNVESMNDVNYQQAMLEPAKLRGLRFEGGLINRILSDVRKEPGALPLLEDTLVQLYEQRERDLLTLRAYEESGGVQASLSKRANATFNALSEQHKSIARRIFLRLTQPGEGAEDTRRRVRFNEFLTRPEERADVEQVLNTLFAARLLTSYSEDGKELQVDVAHEALIRGWPTLRQWIESDRPSLRMQRRLTQDAEQWATWNGADKRSLLYRGPKLALAQEWGSAHEEMVSLSERAFLNAGQNIELRKRQLTWAFIAIGTCFIAVIALFIYQYKRAERSRELAAQVRSSIGRRESIGDYSSTLAMAVEAVEAYETPEAIDALRKAIIRGYHVDLFHPQPVVRATLNADGKYVVTVSNNNIARLWTVTREFETLQKSIPTPRYEFSSPDSITDAVLSRDGSYVLTITNRNTAQVWDSQTGKMLHANIRHDKRFRAVFSEDGRRILSASDDQTARVWDTLTGQMLCNLPHSGNVYHAEFSPTGKYLLTVDGKARLWDGASFEPLRELGELINAATFGSDDSILAINRTSMIGSWNIRNGVEIPADKARSARLLAGIRFGDVSSDGKLIAEISNGKAILRDTDQHNIQQEIREEDIFNVQAISAQFSPDNSFILIAFNGSFTNSVRLYECDVCGSDAELLKRAKARLRKS